MFTDEKTGFSIHGRSFHARHSLAMSIAFAKDVPYSLRASRTTLNWDKLPCPDCGKLGCLIFLADSGVIV